MPYTSEYVPPEIIVSDKQKNIEICRSYKNDEFEQPLEYHYTVNVYEGAEEDAIEFDIRDLSCFEVGKSHRNILLEALNSGIIFHVLKEGDNAPS